MRTMKKLLALLTCLCLLASCGALAEEVEVISNDEDGIEVEAAVIEEMVEPAVIEETVAFQYKDYTLYCDEDTDIVINGVNVTRPTSVKLNRTGTVKLKMTDTLKLKATMKPATALSKLTWKSSNTKVATVSQSGNVKPKKPGTTTITVKTANGKTAKVRVKVVAVKPTKVEITKGSKATIRVGQKLTLKTKLTPAKATTTLTWSTSDKNVATVSSKGVVTAKKKGTATITVKTENGKKASITITVKPKRVELAGYMMKDIKSFAKKYGLKLKIDKIKYNKNPAWGYGSFYYRDLKCTNSQICVTAVAISERKSDLKEVKTGTIYDLLVKGSDYKLLGVYVGMSADSAMNAARKYLNKKYPYGEWYITIDRYDGRDSIYIYSYDQPYVGDFTLKNGKVSDMSWGYVWYS